MFNTDNSLVTIASRVVIESNCSRVVIEPKTKPSNRVSCCDPFETRLHENVLKSVANKLQSVTER